MKSKSLRIIFIFLCFLIILTKTSYGYMDPSAMTYAIQVTATIGITVATGIGTLFYKLRKKFKNKNAKKDEIEENDEIE